MYMDACNFHNAHAVHARYGGIVFAAHKGEQISTRASADAVVAHASQSSWNHGLLTVGSTVDGAGFMFGLIDRACAPQVQVQVQVEVAAAASLRRKRGHEPAAADDGTVICCRRSRPPRSLRKRNSSTTTTVRPRTQLTPRMASERPGTRWYREAQRSPGVEFEMEGSAGGEEDRLGARRSAALRRGRLPVAGSFDAVQQRQPVRPSLLVLLFVVPQTRDQRSTTGIACRRIRVLFRAEALANPLATSQDPFLNWKYGDFLRTTP
ncbi:hypothetical protein GGR56DRAFT_673020 [Xylariaceae sp. FL0804]|nr:hypothetical protein GGR56DRAFT_673020 [Xylariaceae sp. FL0804]